MRVSLFRILVSCLSTSILGLRRRSIPELELVYTEKLKNVLPAEPNEHLEASGIALVPGTECFDVVLDNWKRTMRLCNPRSDNATAEMGAEIEMQFAGFEGIAIDAHSVYHVVEDTGRDLETPGYRGYIVETDLGSSSIKSKAYVNFTFSSANKGFEGLAPVPRHGGDPKLLALCEGNKCAGGRLGRSGGGGRILELVHPASGGAAAMWQVERSIELPMSVAFEDYSAIAIKDRRIAVTSQASAMLWLGELASDGLSWTSDGAIYDFPKSKHGHTKWCNVEGVAFLPDRANELVMVSDKCKSKQPDHCREYDESFAVFRIPDTPGRSAAASWTRSLQKLDPKALGREHQSIGAPTVICLAVVALGLLGLVAKVRMG